MQTSGFFLGLIFLLSFTSTIFAYSPKEGNVTATLGSFFYKTQFEGSDTGAKSPYFGDLGLIVNGDINSKGSLEIAMFHMQKIFVREFAGNYISEKTELMHITMGYRRWLSSYFSASMALFSSYSIGDPQIIHNDFSSGNQIDTSARDITEYGLDFSLQAEVWQQEPFSAIIDTRYSFSVTNKPNERANHYGIFLGLKYFIQEKQVRQRP